MLHGTSRPQSTDAQAANVTSGFVCHRCRRLSRSVSASASGSNAQSSYSYVQCSFTRESTDSGPLPHPSHAGRAHRPCTHSYPSVPVVPTPVLVSTQECTAPAGSGQRQRQRHQAHDPWRSCMRTSFPAILPICSRVLTIPFWMGYTQLSEIMPPARFYFLSSELLSCSPAGISTRRAARSRCPGGQEIVRVSIPARTPDTYMHGFAEITAMIPHALR